MPRVNKLREFVDPMDLIEGIEGIFEEMPEIPIEFNSGEFPGDIAITSGEFLAFEVLVEERKKEELEDEGDFPPGC